MKTPPGVIRAGHSEERMHAMSKVEFIDDEISAIVREAAREVLGASSLTDASNVDTLACLIGYEASSRLLERMKAYRLGAEPMTLSA